MMRPFTCDAASDIGEALNLSAAARTQPLTVDAEVQYLAGGTNLVDLMRLDVMTPSRVIDLMPLAGSHERIEADGSGLLLGAFARMAQVADHPVVRRDYPVLSESLWKAASPQLRNMATLGGNVLQRTRCTYFRDPSWSACNKRRPGSGCAAREGVDRRLAVLGTSEHCIANYPGDFAIALTALGASVEICGHTGETRRIPFEDLHRLPGDTPHLDNNLQGGEVIVAFHVPAGPWTRRSLFLKIRDRASYDFALASAAVAVQIDAQGTVEEARIGIGGLATKPWRAREAESILQGRRLDEATAAEAAAAAFATADASGERAFKRELGQRTLIRALLEAAVMEVQS